MLCNKPHRKIPISSGVSAFYFVCVVILLKGQTLNRVFSKWLFCTFHAVSQFNCLDKSLEILLGLIIYYALPFKNQKKMKYLRKSYDGG